ncbi:MAG: AAA family ATPase [Pseudonocardiaceae bacterium]
MGLAGTGKSTLAGALTQSLCRDGYTAKFVKLSAPLYRLQDIFYAEAGVTVDEARQDQQLMVDIARYLRRISDRALLDRFLQTVASLAPNTAVINDDLREPAPDAHGLREAGFTIIRLECPEEIRQARLVERGDLSTIDERAVFGPGLERIPVDLTLSTVASDVAATAEIALAGALATLRTGTRQRKRRY